MHADGQQHGHVPTSLWVWIGYWACLFVVMHRPLPGAAKLPIPGVDKVAHFVLYAVLVLLGGWHARRVGRRLTVSRLLAWSAMYAAYGAVDEWLQPLVGRTASVGDWAADAAGIVAGTLFIAFLGHSDRSTGNPSRRTSSQ